MMIDRQSQPADMPLMTGTPGYDEDCYQLTKRTSHRDSDKPGLKNLWLRRRAEYTSLYRSGHSRMPNVCVEQGVQ